jgi:hypothetical protein
LRDLVTAAAREARRARICEAGATMPLENAPLVLADWRGDAISKEPNERRSAVVVEEDGFSALAYPNAILLPLTEDTALPIPDLSVAIEPLN